VRSGVNLIREEVKWIFFGRSVSWNRDVTSEKLSFTMRREFDKHKEEEELIKQLKSVSWGVSGGCQLTYEFVF
jgi:hypothetical protein